MNEFDDRFLDVDQHGVLKIPLSLWLALFFLSRSWFFLITSIASPEIFRSVGILASNASFWIILALELPVIILAYAGFFRTPDGGWLARRIWPQGLIIIAFTATANLVFLAWWLLQSDYWQRWPELFLASCGVVDLSTVAATWGSKYIKQIFSEFPIKE